MNELNETLTNLTGNLTGVESGQAIFNQIVGFFSYSWGMSWGLSSWITSIITPTFPDQAKLFMNSAMSVLQLILFIGFISLILKGSERFTNFFRKWVIPFLILIFGLLLFFGLVMPLMIPQEINVSLT